MDKLSRLINLDNQQEEITATQLRSCPGEILTQISMGKTFTVTKNGKPIAVMSKPELNAFELGTLARKAGND